MSADFSKETILQLILDMHLSPVELNGEERRTKSNFYFKTFETVKDPVQYFTKALKTEMEHGKAYPLTNVTDNDIKATAQIVAAHILGVEADESPNEWTFFPAYYDALWWMESSVPK